MAPLNLKKKVERFVLFFDMTKEMDFNRTVSALQVVMI